MDTIIGAEECLKNDLFHYTIVTMQRVVELRTPLRALIFGA